jgi:hypothetical protein
MTTAFLEHAHCESLRVRFLLLFAGNFRLRCFVYL